MIKKVNKKEFKKLLFYVGDDVEVHKLILNVVLSLNFIHFILNDAEVNV